jgi:hypothetical protein
MPCFQFQEGQHLNFALPVDWIANVAQRPVTHLETVPSPGTTPPDWLQGSIAFRSFKGLPEPVKPGSHD